MEPRNGGLLRRGEAVSALSRQRWTFVGVMSVPGIVLFLINDSDRSTRAMVAYCDTEPVVIRELP